jgi:hypothetical protein
MKNIRGITMKKQIPFIYFFISMLIMASSAEEGFSQNIPGEGTLGITASVQSGQTNLLFPYRISDQVAIAPLIGFQSVEDGLTRLQVGIKPQFFRVTGSDFVTYLGGLGMIRIDSPNVGDNDSSFILGFNGGGEYYLSSHFSLGVEGLVNIVLDNRNSIGTGAAVNATFYF